MRSCVIHAAKDLRIETQPDPVIGAGGVVVRVRAGGICGSDLHYFQDGRIGDFVIREPFVPGHEFCGEVVETGAAVTRVKAGDRVAIHPGRACGRCAYCREGQPNLCQAIYFMGSASRFPHMQGGFREMVAVEEEQCYPITADIPFGEIAFAEPLSVALHAGQRAGNLVGKRVLVSGAGPIGQLVLLAARRAGCGHVTVTDILDHPLAIAQAGGADAVVNVAAGDAGVAAAGAAIGGFDVAFEVSGFPAALNTVIEAVRPGATIVLVGSPPAGLSPVLANRIMTRELTLRGAFRFGHEFADAVSCLQSRRIDVRPLLSRTVPMTEAVAAFAAARDRAHNIKVIVAF
ncbi:MAG: L-idonate 5-dehydrogenase [Azospirillaceae bacterium]|nr:L-idonate 5-dehydrogenase [Azospirillaceae bacterium]